MEILTSLNINLLQGLDASATQNVIRRIMVVATTRFYSFFYPFSTLFSTRFSLPPNQNKGREKRKREAQRLNNQ